MKIIKHGDLERLKQIKHFKCDRCGIDSMDKTDHGVYSKTEV